ncbi:MAG: hypothetical protein WCH74_03935 [Chloroflexota bacterium]
MSGRYDQRSQVTPRRPDGGRATVRVGPHLGPIRLTPTRVFIGIALLGSVAYLVYALTVRDANQIPLLASGAAILGAAFLALAIAGLVRAYQAGRAGAGGRSFVAALGGGVALLAAFGAFATAAILALLWRG